MAAVLSYQNKHKHNYHKKTYTINSIHPQTGSTGTENDLGNTTQCFESVSCRPTPDCNRSYKAEPHSPVSVARLRHPGNFTQRMLTKALLGKPAFETGSNTPHKSHESHNMCVTP